LTKLHFYYLDDAGKLLVHRAWSEVVWARDVRRLARLSATARRANLVEIEGDDIHEYWRREGSAWLLHQPTFAANEPAPNAVPDIHQPPAAEWRLRMRSSSM
jgi:hypothetical protein